jgi:hypothetical protein
LIGSDNYDSLLIRSDKTTSPSDSVSFQETLVAGEYNLVIMSLGTSGTIVVYSQGIP